ncbi:acyl carrier protein [Stappia sp. GBMRC 2046]|uniref:Acyl carrier protein n=1 Tax=Stappia sediminis TaxID=2692190 RepID=A0A7X3LRZ7_9HYPH|nr:acyl carrier protein [Stappia sediminis]MXN64032.1 acyl carrier protein [Stappia sediminis]
MTQEQSEDLVKRILFQVAPELEGEDVDPDEPFREQFEIDSMDFLNLVIGLNKETGIEIPEEDYPKLETLSGCVAYLNQRKGQT